MLDFESIEGGCKCFDILGAHGKMLVSEQVVAPWRFLKFFNISDADDTVPELVGPPCRCCNIIGVYDSVLDPEKFGPSCRHFNNKGVDDTVLDPEKIGVTSFDFNILGAVDTELDPEVVDPSCCCFNIKIVDDKVLDPEQAGVTCFNILGADDI